MKLAEIHEKPRERLVRYGSQALSDAELYALILTAGTKKSNVLDIAQRVSFYLSSQRQTPTFVELKQLPGIGSARACQILATIELGRRLREQNGANVATQPVAASAKEIYRLYSGLFAHSFAEEFYVLFLDAKLAVIASEQLFVGTLDSVTVHPREVFHRALKHLAHSIVIMHNHPSGDCSPSPQDIIVTQTIHEVGVIIGIPLIDHIIFGANSFWSWNDNADSNGTSTFFSRKSNSDV